MFEDCLLVLLFGLTFGGILSFQFVLGEVIVSPQLSTASDQLILYLGIPSLIGVVSFSCTGFGTWLVSDKILRNPFRNSETSEEDSTTKMISATPSLLLLVIAWMFASYSRLNEFAMTLILFVLAAISFLMVEFDAKNLIFGTLKSWISCNIVTAIITYSLIYMMKSSNVLKSLMEENYLFPVGLRSNSLSGVLPLWTPPLVLMMATSWGQVCRRMLS